MTDTISLPIKRLDPTVELPSYAYVGDAGLDLRAASQKLSRSISISARNPPIYARTGARA